MNESISDAASRAAAEAAGRAAASNARSYASSFAKTIYQYWTHLSIGTGAVVASCVVLYIVHSVTGAGCLEPAALLKAPISKAYTLISMHYVHSGIFPLIFNVLAIIYFGGRFERQVGSAQFLYLTFILGILIGLFYFLVGIPLSFIPFLSGTFAGCAGGLSGLLFAMLSIDSNTGEGLFERRSIYGVTLMGAMLPWIILAVGFLFLYPFTMTLVNVGGVLVGYAYAAGWLNRIMLPSSFLDKLENFLDKYRIPQAVFVPRGEATASLPTPGRIPVPGVPNVFRYKSAFANMPADIQAYVANTPNGQKVPITLEELGIPYDLHYIDFSKNEQFSPDFLKISPNNKIPAIVDNNPDVAKFGSEPLSVFESAAIMQYLAGEKTVVKDLYPEGRARIKTNEWLYFQIASVGPMMGQLGWFLRHSEKIPVAIKRYEDETHRILGVLEKRLSEVEYLNGHGFSIADIANFCWVRAGLSHLQLNLDKYPKTAAWLEKIAARPAVQKGLQVTADAAPKA
ncbi:hypothetical protein HK102_013125 [Quaeritorhiza haematococci]|nr:hypothetical protein HK102_013125 [Quaeritorhiza haematococci]